MLENLFRPKPQTVDYDRAWKFFESRYENYIRQVRFIRHRVKDFSNIVDVGANIGYFTCLLLYFIRPKDLKSVICYEPVENLFRHLQKTFENDKNVTLRNYALGNQLGTVPLYLAENGNIGWNTMVKEKIQKEMKYVRAPVTTMDMEGLNPSFIKIDVEGYEYAVLRGALKTIADCRPAIYCEIGWGRNNPNLSELKSVLIEIQKLGYTFIGSQGEEVVPWDNDGTTDVLMLPKKEGHHQ